jgi:ribosomal protein L16 Arg81 hydroxylase
MDWNEVRTEWSVRQGNILYIPDIWWDYGASRSATEINGVGRYRAAGALVVEVDG